ncbi:unnamed protein product [Gadus morhua 'NCC']
MRPPWYLVYRAVAEEWSPRARLECRPPRRPTTDALSTGVLSTGALSTAGPLSPLQCSCRLPLLSEETRGAQSTSTALPPPTPPSLTQQCEGWETLKVTSGLAILD